VFDGELYQSLKAEGFFEQKTDMAFALSADGFKATRKDTRNKKFSKGPESWPFLAINLNENPKDRVDFDKIFCLGTVNGKYQPTILELFFRC